MTKAERRAALPGWFRGRLFPRKDAASTALPATAWATGPDLAAPAITTLVRRARKRDPIAQFRLAQAYLTGAGVHYDPIQGGRWLRRAAEAGHKASQSLLALLLLQGRVPSSDRSLFEQERPVPDQSAAALWASRAADTPTGQALLGFLYATGQGVPHDAAMAAAWYERAAAEGSPHGALGLGLIRLASGDAEDARSAVDLVRTAAAAGLPTAQYVYGAMLETGATGASPCPEAAVRLYREAAVAQVRPAQARLGLALLHGRGTSPDPVEAETWLRRAGAAGDAESAAVVGDLQLESSGGSPNYLEAARWYALAARAGHLRAAWAFGTLHLLGLGVPLDPAEGLAWIGKAVEGGVEEAAADLVRGARAADVDVPLLELALQCLEKAASAGDPIGAYNLAICRIEGIFLQQDITAGQEWLLRAAVTLAQAQYWYGRFLLEGKFGSPDSAAARDWLRRAADGGVADAAVRLAELYLNGTGGPRQPEDALRLFQSAARAGHTGAMFATGAMLGGGHGVPTDLETALIWSGRAVYAGHPRAQHLLNAIYRRKL